MEYRFAINLDDLWNGEKLRVSVDGIDVLLVRLDSEIYAYEDRCAHRGLTLATGCLGDGVLTCAAHEWKYDIRTGAGVNPRGATLRAIPVKVERGEVLVDLDDVRRAAAGPRSIDSTDSTVWAGPVLVAGALADVIVGILTEQNPETRVVDRGSYLRVLSPRRCELGRRNVEARLGAPFVLPADLERIMPSFQGTISLTTEWATWTAVTEKSR